MHMLGIHSFESMYEPFLPETLLPDLDVLASSSDDDNVFTQRSTGYSGSVGVASSSVLVQPLLSGHEKELLSISFTPLSPSPSPFSSIHHSLARPTRGEMRNGSHPAEIATSSNPSSSGPATWLAGIDGLPESLSVSTEGATSTYVPAFSFSPARPCAPSAVFFASSFACRKARVRAPAMAPPLTSCSTSYTYAPRFETAPKSGWLLTSSNLCVRESDSTLQRARVCLQAFALCV